MGILSWLFGADSADLLDCHQCGRSVGRANIKKVSESFYYVDCPCGMIADHGVTPEAAAEKWNKKVQEGVKRYEPWKPMSDTEKVRLFFIVFEHGDSHMYEQAETDAEARAAAIRLSKTYGRAVIHGPSTEAIFINGEAAANDGQPT